MSRRLQTAVFTKHHRWSFLVAAKNNRHMCELCWNKRVSREDATNATNGNPRFQLINPQLPKWRVMVLLVFTFPQTNITNTSHLKRLGFICKWGFSPWKRRFRTNSQLAPENGWLEYYCSFLLGPFAYFQGLCLAVN